MNHSRAGKANWFQEWFTPTAAPTRVYHSWLGENGRLQLIISCWVLILETAVSPHLRRKSTDSQRRIMRTYGATFGYLEGEATDPDDQGEDVVVE